MAKKNIPLVVLETIEPFLLKNSDFFKCIEPNGSLLKIIDLDLNSDFYFEVLSFEIKSGKTLLQLDYKPRNKQNTNSYKPIVENTQLEIHFKKWFELVKDYEQIISIYDDPIVKKNADNFYDQFKLIEEDADYVSFNLEQQLYIDGYLDKSKEKIIALKEGSSKDKILELENLEIEIDKIKSNISRESKNKIVKRLSIFWAKSQKTGLEVIKEVFISISVEISKRLLLGQG